MEITELLPNKKSFITSVTELRQNQSSYEVDSIEIKNIGEYQSSQKSEKITEEAIRWMSQLSNAEQKSELYSLEEEPEKIIS